MGEILSTSQTKDEGKRPREEKAASDNHNGESVDQNSPKRKKLKTTSGYIYETLFLNGENSDVTIIALGQEWPLHKLYLCQSGYFKSMFKGPWKERDQNVIHLEIPDNNITNDALHTAFGSMYSDDVYIPLPSVIPLLATTSMLQLDGLQNYCVETMADNIHSKTVCSYHAAAVCYQQLVLEKKCFQWLERSLSSSVTVQLLKDISVDLMREVIQSPDLFVMQIEVDIYNLLKMWTFLKLHPDWCGDTRKELHLQATTFFQSSSHPTFLETPQGEQFIPTFRGLRLGHIIGDTKTTEMVEKDNIIPQSWLHPVFKEEWRKMLAVYQCLDTGPVQIAEEEFNRQAIRCGRILEENLQYYWRWIGFAYGIDIIVTYSKKYRKFSFKRNVYTQPCNTAVCLQPRRHIAVRVAVASFDECGCEKFHKATPILCLDLAVDEEVDVFEVDAEVPFPLHMSVHMVLVSESRQETTV